MAAKAAMFCTALRGACSLARSPYGTVSASSTRATAVPRAGSLPPSPVYQNTVSAGVPDTSAVAVAGGPETRRGGLASSMLKKSLAAASAEAADSDVRASFPRPAVTAVLRLAAVSAGVAPIVNSLAVGVADVVAVSTRFSREPSGRLSVKVIFSPGLGTPAVKSTESAGGAPAGPATVALVSPEVTAPSLKPNGEPAKSSASENTLPAAPGTTRPRPEAPRSAWLRSVTI